MKVTVVIPNDPQFAGEEVIIQFDPDCEGMFWTTRGEPITGITGGWGRERRVDCLLTKKATPGQVFTLYVETACNNLAGNGPSKTFDFSLLTWEKDRETGHDPADPNRYFRLNTAEICVRDQDALQLKADFEVLLGIIDVSTGCRALLTIQEFPAETQIAADALHTANLIVNTFNAKERE
ncbi:Glycoside hydrolase, 38 vacuolar alpha mannosidase [Phlyctochytrium bullatum]|nr:Glycoside hydrolase, 38 vacuolar alpha mannosidase [Phlyctochytrium bullatum]